MVDNHLRIPRLYQLVLTALIVAWGAFIIPRASAEDSDNSVDRIKYYQLALLSQQRALGICRDKLDKFGSEEDTINGQKQKYTRSYFVKLHSVYMVKIINTLKYLAAEHEAVAKKKMDQNDYSDSMLQMAQSARIWEKIGETFENRGMSSMQSEKYTESGAFYEQAYAAYKNAQAKWKEYLNISARWSTEELEKNNKVVKTEIKDNFFDGLDALKTSASAFLKSYNQLREKAKINQGRSNIHKKNLGEEWVQAAQASANYERINTQVKSLQENMWDSFSL